MTFSPWRLSVAPMIDWTHAHTRAFHRKLSKHTRLYSEMLHANAVIHGDRERLLAHSLAGDSIALQLGGSDPQTLAQAARVGVGYGYDEINLNCGCPSDRVQAGSFGASLMLMPERLADCIAALNDAVDVPVTLKHRLGVDVEWSDSRLQDFVGNIAAKGCQVFIVHARIALLKGLSPKENRQIPPLQYERVYRLKQVFPDLTIVLNGGVDSVAQTNQHLTMVDGVMLGRWAYQQPFVMAAWDRVFFTPSISDASSSRSQIFANHRPYAYQHLAHLPSVMAPLVGLAHGLPQSRAWRQWCAAIDQQKQLARQCSSAQIDTLFAAWWAEGASLLQQCESLAQSASGTLLTDPVLTIDS